MATKTEKFFHPKVHSGWTKDSPVSERRAKVLKAHKGDELAAARSLQALANVTQDKETSREAAKDAAYFYKEHRKRMPKTRRDIHISKRVGRLK